MAIGPGIYFDKHKDKSVEELKKILRKSNSLMSRMCLYFDMINERKRKIDDNSCVTNYSTERKVVRTLIAFKKKYPNDDLSKMSYWEVKKRFDKN